MRFLSKVRFTALAAILLAAVGTTLAQRQLPPPPRPAPPGFLPRLGGPPGFMPPAGGFPAMRPGQPMIPRPNPAQVRADIQGILATQPHEVFVRLSGVQGQVLTPAERLDLARQAVARLSTRVEVSNNRWTTLTEVRTACQNADSFDADIRDDLETLDRVAERRALADAVFEVRHLVERGEWSEAVRRGREWLKRLRGLDHRGLDQESLKIRNEVHAALSDVIHAGLQRAALDVLPEGLRTGSLDKVAVADLPPRLHDSVQGLRGLQTVRELAGESRLNSRDVAVLKQNLDFFLKSLRALPEMDPALGSKILQDLAVRHFLEGHTREYRALMPADGPADHAARLLRDLKALAVGKGEVVTATARLVLSAEPGKSVEPPAGVRPLLPESARKSWHPPMKDSANAKSSPLEKAAEAGKELRTLIETNLKTERITQEEKAKEVRGHIGTAQRRLQELEDADGKRLAEVEAALGRPLEAREKIHVRRLAARKQTNRQIVAALKKQADHKPDLKVPGE